MISVPVQIEAGETGVFQIADNPTPYIGDPCSYYGLDTSSTRIIEITKFDMKNKIVSGTFEFTVISEEDCLDTILISDGRFDLKFTL